MLDPKDARVCMLEDDVPNLAGITRVGVSISRNGRGLAKGVVGRAKRFPETKLRSARDDAYPCKYPTLVDEAGRARRLNVHCLCSRVPAMHMHALLSGALGRLHVSLKMSVPR